MLVRKATLDDAEVIYELHMASVRGLCASAYSPEQIEAWLASRVAEDYRAAMTAGETMFVAERAGRIVGFASIKASMLLGLYVDPREGRGAGLPLLRMVENRALDSGVTALSLQATLNAVSFYRRHGFSVDRRGSVLRGGMALSVVEMHKELNGAERSAAE